MLISQLLIGAFFFASILLRTPHLSTAIIVLFTHTKYTPSLVFDVVTENFREIASYQSPPQLYDLIYGSPPPETFPTCIKTRDVAPGPLTLDQAHHSQVAQGLSVSTTPSNSRSSSMTLAMSTLFSVVIVFYGLAVANTSRNTTPGPTTISLDTGECVTSLIISNDSVSSPDILFSTEQISAATDQQFHEDSPFNNVERFWSSEETQSALVTSDPVKKALSPASSYLSISTNDSLSSSEYASTAPTSNQSFGPSTYESGANDDPDFFDVDEYLGTPKDLKRSMQMVGQFPGICEKGLYYSCLGAYNFNTEVHDCPDSPDLAPYDVRQCRHWYRCEKPRAEDISNPTDVLIIDNLNFSIVRDDDDSFQYSLRLMNVFYDRQRLMTELQKLGATSMRLCISDRQDGVVGYGYAVVRFPSAVEATSALHGLQGRCLGHSGRHLRCVFADYSDYKFGGRNMHKLYEMVTVDIPPLRKATRSKKVATPRRQIAPETPKSTSPKFRITKNGRRVRWTGELS